MFSNSHGVQYSRNDSYFLHRESEALGDAPPAAERVEFGRWWSPWQLGGTAGLQNWVNWKEWEKQLQQQKNSRQQTGCEEELQ